MGINVYIEKLISFLIIVAYMNEKEIEVLNAIFAMAAKDPEFRNKLFIEPADILAKYEISDKAKRIITDAIHAMNQ
jgi:hypothetical protein